MIYIGLPRNRWGPVWKRYIAHAGAPVRLRRAGVPPIQIDNIRILSTKGKTACASTPEMVKFLEIRFSERVSAPDKSINPAAIPVRGGAPTLRDPQARGAPPPAGAAGAAVTPLGGSRI